MSVCGTELLKLLEVFLEVWALLASLNLLRQTPQPHEKRISLLLSLRAITGTSEPRLATLLRHPIGDNALWRDEFLPCASTTPSGLALAPPNPGRISLAETLGFTADMFYMSLVTHANILTSGQSTVGYPTASTNETLLPPVQVLIRRFGTMLSPVYCRRMSTRPVSYYTL